MIQVFCNKRGSGKTKALIDLANVKAVESKGDVVYIDDDSRPLLQLDRKIRFITTDEFNLKDYESFYGFLCGVISEDYDIDNIFIDGLFNIVNGEISDAAHLFSMLEKLCQKYNLNIFMNVNNEKSDIPEFMKKYVA